MNLGRSIDLIEIDNLTYNLLTIFASSKEIALFENAKYSQLIDIKNRFETSKASKNLITLAIITRNILDSKTYSISSSELTCGILNENGKTTNLEIREACNKIVHAQHIDFVEISEREYSYLSSKIQLSGERHTKKWTAEFDVYEFCGCLQKII